jgi:hypothetical protein
MTRFAAWLLGIFVAAAAGVLVAAPAPFPRAGRVGPWVDGWDRPVGPKGCRFDRQGDRLTVTVPAGHAGATPASLLRDRIGADFRPADLAVENVGRQAGIILSDGKSSLRLGRVAWRDNHPGTSYPPLSLDVPLKPGSLTRYFDGPPVTGAAFLRLLRRAEVLSLSFSLDGKAWTALTRLARQGGKLQWEHSRNWEVRLRLPRTMKVGVVAEASTSGPFTAVFDHFKLTPLGGRSAARPADAGRGWGR